jgi:four helix bundle protein
VIDDLTRTVIPSGENAMTADEMRARTKTFALRVMNLVEALPNTTKGRCIGNQLIRAGTSVGANYRAACRARSRKEFVAKLGVVVEEADESAFWMELIVEGKVMSEARVSKLLAEANELTAILNASRRTAARRAARIKPKG